VVVWAFAVVVAVNQIGIATELVNTLFMAIVGALALGVGLAFGLGGRETAAQILSKWYAKGQENSENMKKLVDAAGEQVKSGTAQSGQWPTGGYPQGGNPQPADKRHDAEGG
jgi:hypothetical protein